MGKAQIKVAKNKFLCETIPTILPILANLELLKKFLGFIISKRRFFYIEKILNDFLTICSNSRGEIYAELSSAKELNENEVKNINSHTFKSIQLHEC